jgi:outer membrane protein OmpA-like peptidoglycan-associated protein
VDLPPLEAVPQPTLDLAQRTAEQIDDAVTRGWDKAAYRGVGALVLAGEVERILRDTFEQGHTSAPQLREAEAPVLQYFVARHPGLRERLTILRQRAGVWNTQRIGKYLGITAVITDPFVYEIHMMAGGGGEGVEAARAKVRIRYLEAGEARWLSGYEFVGVGGGVGLAPASMSRDIGWNRFYTFEYWDPEDFEGKMDIVGGSAAFGIGYEIEGATFHGSGGHVPVDADVGGWILGTPEAGVSGVSGYLTRTTSGPTPPPTHVPLPPPRFVERFPVYESFNIEFATNSSRLDEDAVMELVGFVGRNHDVFADGDFRLTLVGHASRAGNVDDNLELSERRKNAVRDWIHEWLGRELDEDHLVQGAFGEQEAEAEKKAPTDDSAEDRVVEVTLVGTRPRQITPTP